MLSYKSLFAIIILFALTACNLRPMYEDNGNMNICYPIKIATIKDRDGQILRNYLLDLMSPQGEPAKPRYLLEITLTSSIKSIGVNKDETTSRKEATLTALYRLRNFKTNKILHCGSANGINSFNISNFTKTLDQNYYSDVVAEEYAKKEALRILAEKLVLLITAKLELQDEN